MSDASHRMGRPSTRCVAAGSLVLMLCVLAACAADGPAANPDREQRDELVRARRSATRAEAPAGEDDLFAEADALLEAGEVGGARELYERAAAAGDPRAELALGLLDEGALGEPRDLEAAIGHLEAAADAGLAEAQYRLGLLLLDAGTPGRDAAAALRWLEAAARQDDPRAQYALAQLLLRAGDGASLEVGAAWMRSAAEGGLLEAQHQLGLLLARGRGVERDEAEAVRWWTRAATAGSRDAAHDLGLAWLQGRGVLADPTRAAVWMERAARAGDPRACLRLAAMHEQGVGVARDPVRALAWYLFGEERAAGGPLGRDARVGRLRVEEGLDAAQREAAREAAAGLRQGPSGDAGA